MTTPNPIRPARSPYKDNTPPPDHSFPIWSSLAAGALLISGYITSRFAARDRALLSYFESLPTYDINHVAQILAAQQRDQLPDQVTCEVIAVSAYKPGGPINFTKLGRKKPVAAQQLVDYHIFETIVDRGNPLAKKVINKMVLDTLDPSGASLPRLNEGVSQFGTDLPLSKKKELIEAKKDQGVSIPGLNEPEPAPAPDKKPNNYQYDIIYEDNKVHQLEYGMDSLYLVDRKFGQKSLQQQISSAFPGLNDSSFKNGSKHRVVFNKPDFGDLPSAAEEEQAYFQQNEQFYKDLNDHHFGGELTPEEQQQKIAKMRQQARRYIEENMLFDPEGWPLNPRRFPKNHIVLQRDQFAPDHNPDVDLLTLHYAISQVDDNSPEQEAKRYGWGRDARITAPDIGESSRRFLGMKRTEHIIPLQQEISVIGTFFFRDPLPSTDLRRGVAGGPIMVKSAYHQGTKLWWNPFIGYKTKDQRIEELMKQSDKTYYTALSLLGAGILLGGYAFTRVVKSFGTDY